MIYENGARPPVRELVKYLRPEHVADALSGRFRIGRLLEYRDGVRYPGAHHDPGEGNMSFDGAIVGFSAAAGHKPSPIMTKFFGPGLANSNAKIGRLIIEGIKDCAPDMHIFCAAHRFNLDVYNRPEYGAAIRVTDEYAFCMALTRRLIQLGVVNDVKVPVVSGEIHYGKRRTHFFQVGGEAEMEPTPPWFFIKPDIPRYREEHEWRFAWDTRSLRDNLIVDFPEAARYCEAFDPTPRRPRWRRTSKLRARRSVPYRSRSIVPSVRPARSPMRPSGNNN